MTLKISKLVKSVGPIEASLSKYRRLAKEFLEPDPEATRQSGKSRRITLNDGFKLFLGDKMVGHHGFRVAEAKTVLTELWPWFEREGLLPEKSRKHKPREKDVFWEIFIVPKTTEIGFYYKAEGTIGAMKSAKEPGFKNVMQKKIIHESPVAQRIGSAFDRDEYKVRVLRITTLSREFQIATRDLR